MTNHSLSGEAPSIPPEIPRPRTFMVRLRKSYIEFVAGWIRQWLNGGSTEAGLTAADESQIVEAHQVEITSSGDLLFFIMTFFVTPAGYQPASQLRRAYAKGVWVDMNETLIPAVTGFLIH